MDYALTNLTLYVIVDTINATTDIFLWVIIGSQDENHGSKRESTVQHLIGM